ncbi:YcaO-like family protein [Streptomyces sp. SID10853]|uniref:YcaO-like family protein n=1 Tax=Streptomyces sp. SID10853 TaxID=2706028 RepID=UPI0013C15C35|nr:YcaO-like family protein [Streptomyces sp. SID10853]NDZ76976.1 YcaO-like family protein [Streptomyces sp. SID10853]
MPTDHVILDGTVRTRSPETTWAALVPLLPHFGITRVARLTDLDYLGLPVFTAIRPAARTLSASQGKGATDLLARLSAVMEGIELWHTEQPMYAVQYGPAAQIETPYPLSALPLKTPQHAEAFASVALEWCVGRTLGGREVPVPLDLVRRSARPAWQPDILRASSNGLACGNTRDEAMLHGMYEIVERDALATDEDMVGQRRTRIDPGTVDDPYCRTLVDMLLSAGMYLDLAIVANAYRLPTCVAYIWSEDYPVTFAGAGCHTDPHIALSRALTEAAQSRLTRIAGTRDDLPSHEQVFDTTPARPTNTPGARPWSTEVAPYAPWQGTFADQTQAVAARIEHVTGYQPICVDLSKPDMPYAAVKMICPGTRSRVRRSILR